MKYLQQVFNKYKQQGKCDPAHAYEMISEFYSLKSGKPCDAKTVSDLITQNKLQTPTKFDFVDFCFYGTNFGMMMASKNQDEKEYGQFFLLFTYGSYDPQGTGSVPLNDVLKNMISYFGQMNPNVTKESVEKIVMEHGVQLGSQVDFETFGKLFKDIYEKLKSAPKSQ